MKTEEELKQEIKTEEPETVFAEFGLVDVKLEPLDETAERENDEFFEAVKVEPKWEEQDPDEKSWQDQQKQDALDEVLLHRVEPPPVSASIVIPYLGHPLTPRERASPEWQTILKRNFDNSREHILKYLRQVFFTIDLAHMNRWRSEAGAHFKPNIYRRRAKYLARHQGFIALKEMERYMLEGDFNFAEILQKQRAYNRHAAIETTSVAK